MTCGTAATSLHFRVIILNLALMQGVPVPYKIEVERPQENQHISINYKNMEANNPDIYIDFKIPKDAAVIKI